MLSAKQSACTAADILVNVIPSSTLSQPIALAAARPAGLALPSSMRLFLPVPRHCPIMHWKHTPTNTPFAANAHAHAPHSLHSWEPLAAQSQARGQFGHALLHSLQKHCCMLAPAQVPISVIFASSASLFGRACMCTAQKACCLAPAPFKHQEAKVNDGRVLTATLFW